MGIFTCDLSNWIDHVYGDQSDCEPERIHGGASLLLGRVVRVPSDLERYRSSLANKQLTTFTTDEASPTRLAFSFESLMNVILIFRSSNCNSANHL